MNCKHCGLEMDPGRCGYTPTMCPNVSIFVDIWGTDTLTGKVYEADANPVHCTDSHAYHADMARKEYDEDNADFDHQDGPNDRD